MKGRLFAPVLIVLLAIIGTAVIAGASAAPRIPYSLSVTTTSKDAGNSPMIASGSSFTYQGRLNEGGSPANGPYDFIFKLYDSPSGGNLVSSPVTITGRGVFEGIFTVSLDFGAVAFSGDARWLDISVRLTGNSNYTTLSPR